MFPVQRPYILRYRNNVLVQTSLIQVVNEQNEYQLFSFKVGQNTISFIRASDRLFLYSDGKRTQEWTEVTGADSNVDNIELHGDKFVFYTKNNVHVCPVSRLKVKQNYYVDQNFRKVTFKIVKSEYNSIIGVTDRGSNIVISYQD